MGCDIHIQIERRVDGAWQRVQWTDAWRKQYRDESGALEMPESFSGRNYDLFGIFADVRNGTWGRDLPPIAAPRGFPDDMDAPPTRDDEYPLGDHSFSWLSLRELQEYDWDGPAIKRGWVSHDQARQFERDGAPPTSYSAGGNHGEYVEWTETRRKSVRQWPDENLPILATLGGPDDVRLVFGFDS